MIPRGFFEWRAPRREAASPFGKRARYLAQFPEDTECDPLAARYD
jgi:hypothetical protein